MKNIKYKCKIISPMLLHGANNYIAELRVPSIKSGMRYWYRAIHGNKNLVDLKKEESEIFGGAGDKEAQKSSFKIKLLPNLLTQTQIDPLPHKKNNNINIQGYCENQFFQLQFMGKRLAYINNIFKLTTILSGFGQRSRRGFGSIKVVCIKEKSFNKIIDLECICKLLNNINKKSYIIDGNKIVLNFKNNPQYPYIKSIEIGNEYNDVYTLLKKISQATHVHNQNGMFGSANPKYASPVYISIIENNNNFLPIITTLNATKHIDNSRLDNFKRAIL